MQRIGSLAQKAMAGLTEKRGRSFRSIYVASPGKPIEAWLDPQHRDYQLWEKLKTEIAGIDGEESPHRFAGFIWYQGESNVNRESHRYQEKLETLIQRVRTATGNSELPCVIVQIGAATAYSHLDWDVGLIREAQRRVANRDPHALLVTAIDAPLNDLTVHLDAVGSARVAKRIAAAAEFLGDHQGESNHGGFEPETIAFTDQNRRYLIVKFRGVQQQLKLTPGWLAGFGVSRRSRLPVKLSQLKRSQLANSLPEDFEFPVAGWQHDHNRIVLEFPESLPKDCRLSYAVQRNAQSGPHRRWSIEYGGLHDIGGNHCAAFLLEPIAKANNVVAHPPAAAERKAIVSTGWKQIAINCVGRAPEGVLPPRQVAGVSEQGWQQTHWNSATAGLVPNLFDGSGQVTSVQFETGVWYMAPYFREMVSANASIMATWCKHKQHRLAGLDAERRYDLAVYLLQGPNKTKEQHSPKNRPVRVTCYHIPSGKRLRNGKPCAQAVVAVPAQGTFHQFQIVEDSAQTGVGKNEHRDWQRAASDLSPEEVAEKQAVLPEGNVLLFANVPASPAGEIVLTVEALTFRNKKWRWSETTLAGLQIRPAQNKASASAPNGDARGDK